MRHCHDGQENAKRCSSGCEGGATSYDKAASLNARSPRSWQTNVLICHQCYILTRPLIDDGGVFITALEEN